MATNFSRQNKDRLYVKSPTVDTWDSLNLELIRLENAFSKTGEHMATEVTTTAPFKAQKLSIRYADGVSWNPGQGEGLYISINGVWKKFTLS